MPIYEYRCPNGHTFEIFQKMADAAVERCQECGAAPVEKVLFPVAVHFKGSGFYSTDYGRGRKAGSKDGDSPPSEKKESTPAATGDSAPAKSDSKGDSKGDKKSDS